MSLACVTWVEYRNGIRCASTSAGTNLGTFIGKLDYPYRGQSQKQALKKLHKIC